jgi:hypothetical protein
MISHVFHAEDEFNVADLASIWENRDGTVEGLEGCEGFFTVVRVEQVCLSNVYLEV